MNNQFSFGDMPVPENGLRDVRARAMRIALRARIKRMAQTVVGTVVACLTLVAAGLLADSAPQFAQSDRAEMSVEGSSSAPSAEGLDASSPTPSMGSQTPAETVPPGTTEFAWLAVAATAVGIVLLFGSVWFALRGARGDRPSARPSVPALALLALGSAMVTLGIAKLFT